MAVRKKRQRVVRTYTQRSRTQQSAMEEAVASTNGSRTKKGQKLNMSKNDLSMNWKIVAQVMLGVEPLITSVVTSAVTASTRGILADVTESQTRLHNELATLQKEVRLQRFQLDRLEQYGRRDSVQIHGLAETVGGEEETGEGSTTKLISLAADMGVTLKPDDISISHRIPVRASECRPLIVKFVGRSTKVNMMRSKRALRENQSRRVVYANDDLTQLREIKHDTGVNKVWTIDGRIVCTLFEDGREVKRFVDSPVDLFNLGWSEEKVGGLGLY